MKVAIFEVEQWEHDACLRLEPRHQISCTHDTLDARSARRYPEAEALSPFVYSRLDAEVLEHFPRLRLIATRSTGYDHIDLEFCRAHEVTVCNVPAYGDATVAEHAFALLLAVARRLAESVERTRRGRFDQSGLRGFELRGKTLAVIGAGRIGRCVIGIAKGFGMEVVAVDARPDEATARRLGFRYVPLSDALAEADVVSLHVPASPETVHLISDSELSRMKQGAVLINTARGSVVDVEALVRALASGRLGGAGLDVLPQEPALREEAEIFRSDLAVRHDFKVLVANHALLQFPNVVVTPHNAYNTTEALHRIIEITIENIEAYARGEPQNLVEL